MAITEKAIRYDEFLKNYLKQYLDISADTGSFTLSNVVDGIQPVEYERFRSLGRYALTKDVPYDSYRYFLAGSWAEDYPNLPYRRFLTGEIDPLYFRIGGSRASHHFHDPTAVLDTPGLDNSASAVTPLVRRLTNNLNDLSGISAANRAFDADPVLFGYETAASAVPRNYFGRRAARDYYLKALTSATERERSHYFALTFLSLGHVMHLVEDMAVPAHTRNDMSRDHLYTYLDGFNRLFHNWKNFEDYVLVEKTDYIRKLQRDDIPTVSLADFGAFWDNGPDTPLGLANYSNAGFLSMGTMFTGYASPDYRAARLNVTSVNPFLMRAYLMGATPLGEPVDHLARITLSSMILNEVLNRAFETTWAASMLDEECYEDYSRLLVPKAVAYASGVLKHFFRGRLGARFGADGRLEISNLADAAMEGEFTLYADAGLPDGARSPIQGASWHLALPAGETRPVPTSISLPDAMDPDRPLTLVFRGTLGDELDAVAGLAFRAPNQLRVWKIDYYNDDTRFLYDADENTPLPACWISWHRGRFLMERRGARTAYHLLALTHIPGAGPPLPVDEGLKALCDMVPYTTGSFAYSFPGTQGDVFETWRFRKAFAWTTNSCSDPTALAIVAARPGWTLSPPRPNYVLADSPYPNLPWPDDDAYREERQPAFMSRQEVDAFLASLHPRLFLPSEMRPPGTTYALVTIPIPDPETYDLSDERCVGVNPSRFDPAYLTGPYTMPTIWDLFQAQFVSGPRTLVPAVSLRNDVFGADFRRSVEWRLGTFSSQDLWTYNPADPSAPLFTPSE